ncbi:MAG: NYN domain-containing protein [Candidatus Pacebacteria bacterium]|nr:NYN domain-containing protein [Candidatus Paceibacterota bacterium]MBP9840117.1 NYN domain-containing protein [Candidatus Paceibacterota bacterium]
MKRYAFIDVENTATTAEDMLGFVVDWSKVADFLKNVKSCTEVFYYTAIETGDAQKAAEFEAIDKTACCVVRAKQKMLYKRKDKYLSFTCSKCGEPGNKSIDMGYNVKGNCDVELTVDALEHGEKDNEFYIFTGDGDFEYLAIKLMERGVKVVFVSHAKVIQRAGQPYGRYSKKLRDLVAANPTHLSFQELDNWKKKFERVIVP